MLRSTLYLCGLTALCGTFGWTAGLGETPVIHSISPTTGPTMGNTTVKILGSGLTNATAVLIDGRPAPFRLVQNGTIEARTPSGVGANVSIVVVGAHGGISPPFEGFSYKGPVIYNISPTGGPAYLNTPLLIFGENFGINGTVTVGRDAVPVASYGDDQIRVLVPPGQGQKLPVRVIQQSGRVSDPFIGFSYFRPGIKSIFPMNGTRLGGTLLTIGGSYFGPAGNMTIGGKAATISHYSNSSITAKTPPGSEEFPPIQILPAIGDASEPYFGFRYDPCPPGYFDPQNSGECRPCRPGTFSSTSGAEHCLPCPPGRFQAMLGQAECRPCPPGSMQDQLGQTECVPCQPGTVAPQEGSARCALCILGRFQPDSGQVECVKCPAGEAQPLTGQTSCEPCAPGTFAAVEGSGVCLACGPGFVQPEASGAECVPCEPGMVQGDSGQLFCDPCPVGTYQPQPGQSECLECPLGMFQLETGGASCMACDLAPSEFQVDFDGDGLIDICDRDIDDDGVLNPADLCDFTPLDAAVDRRGRSLCDVDEDCDTDLGDYRGAANGFTGPFFDPVDCVVGDWSAFSECSVECGGGIRCRTREVLQAPFYGGEPCPILEDCRTCNGDPCP